MPRFIISHRRAGKFRQADKQHSRAALDLAVERLFERSTAIQADTRPSDDTSRRVLHVEADSVDMAARMSELPSDVLIEPEILHFPAWTYPLAIENLLKSGPAFEPDSARDGVFFALPMEVQLSPPPAVNTTLQMMVLGAGQPLAGVALKLLLRGANNVRTSQSQVTAANGEAAFNFGPEWQPVVLIAERVDYWTRVVRGPVPGLQLELQPLPRGGPLGWWHAVAGLNAHDPARGSGVRVGVIDTGVGPHPAVAHVRSIGAFLGGVHNPGGGADLDQHGTHVAGTIGARPVQPGDYAGFAAGADVFSARVFPAGGGANQGDIADAIDWLSKREGVDLINMSLGSRSPSAIMRDAMQDAAERGTLCLCSAGNDGTSPVGFPARFPEAVAIGAIGSQGWGAAGSPTAANYPNEPRKLGRDGLFLAEFSNFGSEVAAVAPGNGIISTVPAAVGESGPFAAFDGTSMACPSACGILAGLLAQSPAYLGIPRAITRSHKAREILRSSCRDLGLHSDYQGRGLPTV